MIFLSKLNYVKFLTIFIFLSFSLSADTYKANDFDSFPKKSEIKLHKHVNKLLSLSNESSFREIAIAFISFKRFTEKEVGHSITYASIYEELVSKLDDLGFTYDKNSIKNLFV